MCRSRCRVYSAASCSGACSHCSRARPELSRISTASSRKIVTISSSRARGALCGTSGGRGVSMVTSSSSSRREAVPVLPESPSGGQVRPSGRFSAAVSRGSSRNSSSSAGKSSALRLSRSMKSSSALSCPALSSRPCKASTCSGRGVTCSAAATWSIMPINASWPSSTTLKNVSPICRRPCSTAW
ncbi:hypothetical protein FQZ97_869000 [compost metagenome]